MVSSALLFNTSVSLKRTHAALKLRCIQGTDAEYVPAVDKQQNTAKQDQTGLSVTWDDIRSGRCCQVCFATQLHPVSSQQWKRVYHRWRPKHTGGIYCHCTHWPWLNMSPQPSWQRKHVNQSKPDPQWQWGAVLKCVPLENRYGIWKQLYMYTIQYLLPGFWGPLQHWGGD